MGMHERTILELGRKSGGDGGKPEEMSMKQLIEALNSRDAEIKKFCENAQKEIKDTGKMAEETKGALELLAKNGTELQDRLTELEQKNSRRGKQESKAKSWGESVAESEGTKSLIKDRRGSSGRIDVKAITSVGDGGSAGDLVRPQRLPGIISSPDEVLTVRSLIMPGRTISSSIEYVQETGFTNNAAPAPETTLKAESDIKFGLANANVRTIAHWVQATKQILDDTPQLASYIDGRLRYGLAYVEDQQLLLGDGTGENLFGILPQASDYNTARTKAGDTRIDVMRHAILQVRLAQYRASGIVLHPADWEAIELTKTDDNAYIFANPVSGTQPRLWGLPVVESDAIPEGTFLTGAWNMGAQIFDRETTTVEVSTEDRDNFIKNMVTVRAEERLALAVYRPESFVSGVFPDTVEG
ncbi:phage major capsid protein [Salinicola sp. CPA57]|uniref:phage major capsid protein n=1 Tax=Salinicola sp. CPA57 TaxID=1949080 RepID=UPI0018E52566|nr:phage major capsid protein [Salinicola sp. CPA57]